jgi:hypothetical protein
VIDGHFMTSKFILYTLSSTFRAYKKHLHSAARIRKRHNKFLAPSSFLCWVAPESPCPVTPHARNHERAGASGIDVRLRTLLRMYGQLGFWIVRDLANFLHSLIPKNNDCMVMACMIINNCSIVSYIYIYIYIYCHQLRAQLFYSSPI